MFILTFFGQVRLSQVLLLWARRCFSPVSRFAASTEYPFKMKHSIALQLTALGLLVMPATAGIIIKETFSGKSATPLVGEPTPDGNEWSGGAGEQPKPDEEAEEAEPAEPAEPVVAIKQDGSAAGIAFTAYHPFTLKPGAVYALEAKITATNEFDNQWLAVGFAVDAKDGSAAPQGDGGTTYGQSVLSGSGYRYGWAGPDTNDMAELFGPGLRFGSVKVVLDTTKASDYTIELFDGNGDSMHGPQSIGTPGISQIFIGNSGTGGSFGSVTLSDDRPEAEVSEDPEPAE